MENLLKKKELINVNKESSTDKQVHSIKMLFGVLIVLVIILTGIIVWQYNFNKQVSSGL